MEVKDVLRTFSRTIVDCKLLEDRNLMILLEQMDRQIYPKSAHKLTIINVKTKQCIFIKQLSIPGTFTCKAYHKNFAFYLGLKPTLYAFPTFSKYYPISSLPEVSYYKAKVLTSHNALLCCGQFTGLYMLDLDNPQQITHKLLEWYDKSDAEVRNFDILTEKNYIVLLFDQRTYLYLCTPDLQEPLMILKEADNVLQFYRNDSLIHLATDVTGKRFSAISKSGRIFAWKLYKDDVNYVGGQLAECFMTTTCHEILRRENEETHEEDFALLLISAPRGKDSL